jgi:hypothetical protein
MMLMIPSRGQGVAREGLRLFDHLVNRVLEFVSFAAFFLLRPALIISLIAVDGFHLADQAGALAAPSVFRGHFATPSNGTVDVGSAIPANYGNVYYAFWVAPLQASVLCMQ